MGKYLIKTIKIGDDGKHGDWIVESDWMLVDPENIHTINIFGKKYTDEKVINTEAKHGRWIKTGQSLVFPEKFRNYFCSECGLELDKSIRTEHLRYCPNCGAQMIDEVENG